MKLSEKQQQVVDYLMTVESARLSDVYSNVNFGYYHNWAKHLGDMIRRLIDRGIIEREKKGVYRMVTKDLIKLKRILAVQNAISEEELGQEKLFL